MKAEEIKSTIRRLIKTEDGIDPALRLLDQMIGVAAINDNEAENLRREIERRRIRLLAEAAVDGAEVDTTGMTYENVLASLQDLVSETNNPDLKRMADGVSATFGDVAAAGRMKPGGARARRSGNVVVAPSQGEDLGLAVATDGQILSRFGWMMVSIFFQTKLSRVWDCGQELRRIRQEMLAWPNWKSCTTK